MATDTHFLAVVQVMKLLLLMLARRSIHIRISLSKNEYEKVENLINEIIDYSKDLIHVSLNIKNKNLNLENKNLKNIFREDFIKESILKKLNDTDGVCSIKHINQIK